MAGIRHVTLPKAWNIVPKGQFFGPPAALMPPQITWITPEPEDVKGKTGILSSDSGDYQYEALAPGAEMMLLPEPIPPAHVDSHKPMIAIVMDDMGLDRKHSARAVNLPAAVTLSYLPYSAQIREQTEAAKKGGHELLVHIPMQPDRKTADPGPDYLGSDMSPLELHERIAKNLAAFDGYAGVNNHMGSKFTRDKDGLNVVMAALEEKKLIFLDSRTSPKSVAEDVARAHHLETSHRDVFIDNEESAAAVDKSLKHLERVARHAGAAIAIGHPKDVTLDALEKWLPTLKEKGFDLVPLSKVIALRNAPQPAVAAATIKPAAKPAAEKTPDKKAE
ncbi:MAG: divergent polysaccharide deacetylase family protein [Alphaproteobacteria bacterium]